MPTDEMIQIELNAIDKILRHHFTYIQSIPVNPSKDYCDVLHVDLRERIDAIRRRVREVCRG